jgi:hypothetical protein
VSPPSHPTQASDGAIESSRNYLVNLSLYRASNLNHFLHQDTTTTLHHAGHDERTLAGGRTGVTLLSLP